MSKSQYKIKGGRPRSRSAKPYEKNKNLVSKVKSWLTPSSWLNYWSSSDACDTNPPTASSNNGGHSSTSRDHSNFSTVPIFRPELNSPVSVNDQLTRLNSSEGTPTSVAQSTEIPQRSHDKNPYSTTRSKDVRTSLNSKITKSQPLSALGNISGGDQDVSTSSSNESWVAEDTEFGTGNDDDPEQHDDGFSPGKKKRKPLATSPLSRSSHPTHESLEIADRNPGFARALTPVQAGGSGIVEHMVQFVSNPAFSNTSTTTVSINKTPPKRFPHINRTVNYSRRDTTGFSVDFSRRLYSASTSTPQLSPVHEQLEENMQQDTERATSPFNPIGVSLSQSLSRTLDQTNTTSTKTPIALSRTYTDESIKRSPFRSPFYSGRTSFGGASSGQKLQLKRPRTESSPPVLAPLRVSVYARPASSLTAKKINDTLNSLSSPLTDARKLPMRNLPPEMQQAKRRRLTGGSQSGNTILSPPPVTPLNTSTTSHNLTPKTQIVPNERTSPRKQQRNSSINFTDGGNTQLSSSHAPTTTSSLATKLNFSLPQFSSASSQRTVLSNLTFSAPPLQQSDKSGQHTSGSLDKERSPQTSPLFMPAFHSGGKMTRRSKGAQSRHPDRAEEEDDDYVNPVAPPPQVGLSLGHGGSLPTFNFHAQLLSDKKLTSPKSKAPTVPATNISSVTPSFTFSSPTPVHDDTTLPAATASKGIFGFSAPQRSTVSSSHSLPMAVSLFSSTRSPFSVSKQPPHPAVKPNQPTRPSPKLPEISKPCPPLKNMSVVDALKKPEYSQFLPTDKTKHIILGVMPKAKDCDVVDLTNSDSEEDSLSKKESDSTSNPLSKFAPVPGTWSCHVCLVNNSAEDLKCVACQADKVKEKTSSNSGGLQLEQGGLLGNAKLKPLTQFSPPAGSWECGTCLVRNKPTDEKCAACSSAKPATKVSTSDNAKVANGTKSGTLSTNTGLKPVTSAPALLSWTCDTCLVPNKAEDDKCIACTTPKPGVKQDSQSTKDKDNTPGFKLGPSGGFSLGSATLNSLVTPTASQNKLTTQGSENSLKTSGLVLGSSSGFKLTPGISLGGFTSNSLSTKISFGTIGTVTNSLSPAKGSNVTSESKLDPLKAESKSPFKLPPVSKTSEKSLLGAPVSVASGPSITPTAGSSESVTEKTVSNTGGPLVGIKLGENLKTGTALGGINFGGLCPSTSSNTTGFKLGEGIQTTSSSTLLTGNKLVGTSFSGTPQLGGNLQTTFSTTLGITLGGSLQSTASGTPLLSGIKVGESLLSTSSTPLTGIKLGGSVLSTSSSTPLTGIKLGGGNSSSTPGFSLGGNVLTTSNNTPLTGIKLGAGLQSSGIKLGGTFTTPSPALGNTNMSTTTAGTVLSTSTFVFGQPSASDLQQNSSSTQKLFKFTGATTTSANLLTGSQPNLIFGTPQSQPSSVKFGNTPLGDVPAHTESLSQDHEMNVEQEVAEQSQGLMFGSLKNQQPTLSSNIFGNQQSMVGHSSNFNFHANPQSGSTGEAKEINVANSMFKFGAGSSNSSAGYSFSASTQPTSAESAKIPTLGKSTVLQPNIQSSGFNFGNTSEMNFNFVPSQPSAQGASQSMFTAGSSTSTRVIIKARRRKPAQ